MTGGLAGLFEGNVDVVGDFFVAGVKAFIHDHPTDPTKEIVYICLEGGEAGTYCRGEGKLENGAAEIELPEHFSLVTNEKGITVQVTPAADCKGLYVFEYSNQKIIVKELGGGKSGAKFHWTVNGVRAGYENHEVIRDKKLTVKVKAGK
jgi:hypothetical protein